MFRRKDEESEATVETKEDVKETPTAASSTPATPSVPSVAQPTPQAPKVQAQQPASPYRPATPAPAVRPQSFGGVAAQPAAAPGEEKGKRRILTVGNDILLKGEIATCDRLVIEGAVDAKLNDVHTVEIAQTGSFKGSAEIEDAEISGLFEGDLIVRNRLIIYSTGKVRGKITYGEIEIERGGELTGEIRSSSSPVEEKKEKAA